VYWDDDEWRFFVKVVLGASGVLLAAVLAGGHFAGQGLETSIRHSVFQAVSLVTTTGYVTADYEQWAVGAQLLLLLLMFVGGMAGSTGGGMKAARVQVLVKHMFTEMKKSLNPRAVILTRVGRRVLKEDVLLRIVAFMVLYVLVFVAGCLALSFLGFDLVTAVGAAAATLGNIGPGLGDVGAVDNYGWMSGTAKMLLTFLMVVGRLELFTVLLLLSPGSHCR
jgi:trk system potassium uptake protein TrkH